MSAQRLVDVLRGLRDMGKGDPKAWAYRLRDRELRGETLTIAQREMWRAALQSWGPMEAQR